MTKSSCHFPHLAIRQPCSGNLSSRKNFLPLLISSVLTELLTWDLPDFSRQSENFPFDDYCGPFAYLWLFHAKISMLFGMKKWHRKTDFNLSERETRGKSEEKRRKIE
jgi:hypothetical protein